MSCRSEPAWAAWEAAAPSRAPVGSGAEKKPHTNANNSVLQSSHYADTQIPGCKVAVGSVSPARGSWALSPGSWFSLTAGIGIFTEPWQSSKELQKAEAAESEGSLCWLLTVPSEGQRFLQTGRGATGHQEPFQLRLPARRSVGSNTNGAKPPIHITSSITAPDDKWSWVCTRLGWWCSAKHGQIVQLCLLRRWFPKPRKGRLN